MTGLGAIDRLQVIAAQCWGYAELSYLDGWEMRAADGFTLRANSVWPVGRLDRSLEQAIAAMSAWYAERGLLARVQCIAGSELDFALTARGHTPTDGGALRQTADVLEALSLLVPPDAKVSLAGTPDDTWMSLYRTGGLPPVAPQVLGSGDRYCYSTIHDPDDGSPLAVGRAVLVPDEDRPLWVGLAAIETAPAARRRGLAKAVMRAMLEWAAERGARQAVLEVTPGNDAALSLYRSIGFRTRHMHHCRVITPARSTEGAR